MHSNHIINVSVIIFKLYITDVETFNNNARASKLKKNKLIYHLKLFPAFFNRLIKCFNIKNLQLVLLF